MGNIITRLIPCRHSTTTNMPSEGENINHTLPPEILTKIFRHCAHCDLFELFKFRTVCRLWRDLIGEYFKCVPELTVVIRRRRDVSNLPIILLALDRIKGLNVVWERKGKVSANSLLNRGLLTQLESFKFGVRGKHLQQHIGMIALLDHFLSVIIENNTDTLTTLELVNVDLTASPETSHKFMEVTAASRASLTHLTFLSILDDDNDDISELDKYLQIIPNLTRLKSLDIRGINHNITMPFIAAVKSECVNISNNIKTGLLLIEPSDDVNLLHCVSYVECLFIHGFHSDELIPLLSCLQELHGKLEVVRCAIECASDTDKKILQSLVLALALPNVLEEVDCNVPIHT